MMRCSAGRTTTARGATLSRQQITSSSSTVRADWGHLCSVQHVCVCAATMCASWACRQLLPRLTAVNSQLRAPIRRACMHVTLKLVAGNENTPALLQNIAVAISSATAAGGAEAQRRRGSVAGGLRGDLWGQNPAVVLLADKPKEEMDAAVQEVIRWGLCPALYMCTDSEESGRGGALPTRQQTNRKPTGLCSMLDENLSLLVSLCGVV